jgi:hypothetical protein
MMMMSRWENMKSWIPSSFTLVDPWNQKKATLSF